MGLFDWVTDNPLTRMAKSYLGADASPEEAEAGALRARQEPLPTFIRERMSTMFFDADGDLAHEFFEEVVGGLRQLTEGLIPQGTIELECPVISPHVRAVLIPNHRIQPEHL